MSGIATTTPRCLRPHTGSRMFTGAACKMIFALMAPMARKNRNHLHSIPARRIGEKGPRRLKPKVHHQTAASKNGTEREQMRTCTISAQSAASGPQAIEVQGLSVCAHNLSRGAPSTARPPLHGQQYRRKPPLASGTDETPRRRNLGTFSGLPGNIGTLLHILSTQTFMECAA